jgi:predicted amidohydrolase YtcJ
MRLRSLARREVLQGTFAAALAGTARAQAPAGVPLEDYPHTTVFVAKKIVTMDPARPYATAVAVRHGYILGVGSLEDLAPWLKPTTFRIDRQFEDKVLFPGLIDPHVHPMRSAMQFGMHWITPEAWDILGQKTPATIGQGAYVQALRDALAAAPKTESVFITWGYTAMLHGAMSRSILDSVAGHTPVIVWQHSFREVYANSAALKYFESKGVTEGSVKGNPQADWAAGRFRNDALSRLVMPALADFLLAPARINAGLLRTRDYFASNGVTTCADMSTGALDWQTEIAALTNTFGDGDSPVRVRVTPDVRAMAAQTSPGAAFAFLSRAATKNTHHIFFNNAISLSADGDIFSQMMQIASPGYTDGHDGAWLTEPLDFETEARPYWKAGYQIHASTYGDVGATMALDTLATLQTEHPRADHRFTLDHFACAPGGADRRIAALGAQVSANPFYIFDLGDCYAANGLGGDRAAKFTPLGSLVQHGIPAALHSDFAAAPAAPLLLAWMAITRQTQSGKIFSPEERLTLDQALRAITIDAAYILRLEDDSGSIQAGKRGDFAVLDKDPYEAGVDGLRDIKVWGTVYAGGVFQGKTG